VGGDGKKKQDSVNGSSAAEGTSSSETTTTTVHLNGSTPQNHLPPPTRTPCDWDNVSYTLYYIIIIKSLNDHLTREREREVNELKDLSQS